MIHLSPDIAAKCSGVYPAQSFNVGEVPARNNHSAASPVAFSNDPIMSRAKTECTSSGRGGSR